MSTIRESLILMLGAVAGAFASKVLDMSLEFKSHLLGIIIFLIAMLVYSFAMVWAVNFFDKTERRRLNPK